MSKTVKSWRTTMVIINVQSSNDLIPLLSEKLRNKTSRTCIRSTPGWRWTGLKVSISLINNYTNILFPLARPSLLSVDCSVPQIPDTFQVWCLKGLARVVFLSIFVKYLQIVNSTSIMVTLSSSHCSSHKVKIAATRKTLYKNSFSFRTASLWDSLPENFFLMTKTCINLRQTCIAVFDAMESLPFTDTALEFTCSGDAATDIKE